MYKLCYYTIHINRPAVMGYRCADCSGEIGKGTKSVIPSKRSAPRDLRTVISSQQ